MKALTGIAILVLCLTACTDPEAGRAEVEALMQETLDDKVSTYKQSLQEDCQERILTEAAAIADSIIVAEARLRRDTAGKPPIPLKPERPELRRPSDTLPVRPLLPDTDTTMGPDTSRSTNR